MRIGELAGYVEESTRTIRFYESIGILPEPRRTPNGYRDYDPEAIGQIRLIGALQCARFSLADISTLFALGRCPCRAEDARMFIADKQAQVDAQLETLARVRSQLKALLATTSPTQSSPATRKPKTNHHQPRHLVAAE